MPARREAPILGATRMKATNRVPLGRSGLLVPRLAMGTGTSGWERVSDQTRLGQRDFTRLMRHGVA